MSSIYTLQFSLGYLKYEYCYFRIIIFLFPMNFHRSCCYMLVKREIILSMSSQENIGCVRSHFCRLQWSLCLKCVCVRGDIYWYVKIVKQKISLSCNVHLWWHVRFRRKYCVLCCVLCCVLWEKSRIVFDHEGENNNVHFK